MPQSQQEINIIDEYELVMGHHLVSHCMTMMKVPSGHKEIKLWYWCYCMVIPEWYNYITECEKSHAGQITQMLESVPCRQPFGRHTPNYDVNVLMVNGQWIYCIHHMNVHSVLSGTICRAFIQPFQFTCKWAIGEIAICQNVPTARGDYCWWVACAGPYMVDVWGGLAK